MLSLESLVGERWSLGATGYISTQVTLTTTTTIIIAGIIYASP